MGKDDTIIHNKLVDNHNNLSPYRKRKLSQDMNDFEQLPNSKKLSPMILNKNDIHDLELKREDIIEDTLHDIIQESNDSKMKRLKKLLMNQKCPIKMVVGFCISTFICVALFR